MGCKGRGRIYGSGDANYFAELDLERVASTGVYAEYYSLNRGRNVDAVYSEPDNDPLYGGTNPRSPRGTPQTHDMAWNFCPDIAGGDAPLLVSVSVEYVEYDNRNPSVRSEGRVTEWDAVMSMPKLGWQCALDDHASLCVKGRVPKEGDVVFVFGQWWDIVKVGGYGSVLGTADTIGYRFDLKKRSAFTPNRKVELP